MIDAQKELFSLKTAENKQFKYVYCMPKPLTN